MKRGRGFLPVGLGILLAFCGNRQKEHDSDQLYFDYRITGDEEANRVSCLFQYRLGGPEGAAVAIGPGSVTLDGEEVPADSARLSGVYYEVDKPLDAFAGKHDIIFTGPEGEKYKQRFDFTPFQLRELPAQIHRAPFVLYLAGISKGETRVHLVLVDTAFTTNDVNRIISIVRGELPITEDMLRHLSNGPISMELDQEEEIPLKQTGRAGGRLLLSYAVNREFELTE